MRWPLLGAKPKAIARLQHLFHDLLLGFGLEADVDEAGTGDVDFRHPLLVHRLRQQRLAQLLTHLARVELEGFGQLHGRGDGEIAVGRHFGGFEGRLGARTGRHRLQRGGQAGQQFLFDLEHRGGILGGDSLATGKSLWQRPRC